MNYPAVRTMSEVVDFAVAAEEAGWDGVFVSDSITDGTTDPWVLSDGRLLLGVGLGVGTDFDQFGDEATPRERARRYDEALEVMALLWSGESVTFDGEFFRLDDVTLPVVPKQQPRVPIVVAGWWPNRRPFERAARWDGTMPYWPALLEGQVGPEGQTSTGTVEGELRELMGFCRRGPSRSAALTDRRTRASDRWVAINNEEDREGSGGTSVDHGLFLGYRPGNGDRAGTSRA